MMRTLGLSVSIACLMLSVGASRYPGGAGRRLSGAAVALCACTGALLVVEGGRLAGAALIAATALSGGAILAIRRHALRLARGTYAAYRQDDPAVADRRRRGRNTHSPASLLPESPVPAYQPDEEIWETCAGCGRQYAFPHLCREHLLCGVCHPVDDAAPEGAPSVSRYSRRAITRSGGYQIPTTHVPRKHSISPRITR